MTLFDPAERTLRGATKQAEVAGTTSADNFTLIEDSWRDFVYAEVWSREGLDRRARFLISLAGATISGGSEDLITEYARSALRTGDLSLSELREAALHLAVYAGWARGTALDKCITKAAADLRIAPARHEPIRSSPWDPEERIAQGIAEFENVMTFPGPPPVTPYFEAGIDSFVFGEMWCRAGLDQRSRRWITLVGVCESAAEIPILSHIHAAMASGNCTADELQEFVLHYAVFGGWPKASVVQGAVSAMAKKVAEGLPYNG